jgi:glycosyltransferase involved in cell wall biosynthesis
MQYVFDDTKQWGESYIELAWSDFAGNETGIIFSIWDPSRLTWFSCPQYLPNGNLKTFLMGRHFQRWGYFPIDSLGPGGKLTTMARETLLGYDRILAYTAWGQQVIENTTGRKVEWIPHGINTHTFSPQGRERGREFLGPRAHMDDLVIGCVATNQARKDWGLVFTVASKLREKHPNLLLWCHTDLQERHWSFPALVNDFGMGNNVLITVGRMKDSELALAYSACDVTLHPGLGEGFCFPLAESLACGVPGITGNYGGAPEMVPCKDWLIDPHSWRLDTLHNCLRPVFLPEDWLAAIEKVLESTVSPETCTSAVSHLSYANLWPATWEKWFLEGLK